MSVEHEGDHAVQIRPEIRLRGRGTLVDVPVPGQPGTVLPVRHRGVPRRVPGARLRQHVGATAAAANQQGRVRGAGLADGQRHADGQHDGVRAGTRRDGPQPDAVRRPSRRRHSAAVAVVSVHSVRTHVPHHARHQRVPVLGDDVLVRPHRHHRKGTEHHRRLRPVPQLARFAVRIQVKKNTYSLSTNSKSHYLTYHLARVSNSHREYTRNRIFNSYNMSWVYISSYILV